MSVDYYFSAQLSDYLFADVWADITTMKSDMTDLKVDAKALKTDVTTLRSDVTALRDDVTFITVYLLENGTLKTFGDLFKNYSKLIQGTGLAQISFDETFSDIDNLKKMVPVIPRRSRNCRNRCKDNGKLELKHGAA